MKEDYNKSNKKSENSNAIRQNVLKNRSFASTFRNSFENYNKNNSTLKFLLDEGLRFYNNGEYKKAINCFQIVLDMEPNNTECKKQLLESAMKLEDQTQLNNCDENNILPQTLNLNDVLEFDGLNSDLNKEIKDTIRYPSSEENDISIDNYDENFKEPGFTDNNVFNNLFSKSAIIDTNNKSHWATDILAKKTMRKNLGKTSEPLISSIKNNNEGIAIFDLDGKLVFLNNTFADMHGYSTKRMIGKHLSTFHKNDHLPVVEAANNQIKQTGEFSGEMMHLKSDGSIFPILTHQSLLWNDSSKPIGVIGTYFDLTNLRIMEEEITRFNSAIEQSIDGIAIADLQLKLLYVNDAFASMHGFSQHEMYNMDIEKLYNKVQVEIFKKRIDYIPNQGLWAGEMGCIKKDGTAFPLYISITLIRDDFDNPNGVLLIARDIIERDRAELIAQEVNKNLDSIINTIHEPLIILDINLKILTGNKAFYKAFNQTQSQIKGQLLYNIANHQLDEPKLHELLEDLLPKNKRINNFEIEYNFHLDSPRTILFNAKVINRGENRTKLILLAMEDISERKQAEEELKWKLMKFKMEDGRVYLVKETNPSQSIEAFKDLLKIGYNGLIISRTPEKDFKKGVINGDCEFIWLAEKGKDKSMPPKLNEIELKIENLNRKHVILIDRGDYLFFKNGFKRTLSFIHRLRELAYIGGNVVIISFDPATLDDNELNLIEKECSEIEPRLTKKKLHEKQQKILRIIYEDNLIGKKPTYTVIGQELGISKPTARKRIRVLISVGYIMESVKGRNKILELTEMGKSLFQN